MVTPIAVAVNSPKDMTAVDGATGATGTASSKYNSKNCSFLKNTKRKSTVCDSCHRTATSESIAASFPRGCAIMQWSSGLYPATPHPHPMHLVSWLLLLQYQPPQSSLLWDTVASDIGCHGGWF